jgi:hypothetical protein
MKNKIYLLTLFVAVGFTSCQKAPYATFQKSHSETFVRTIKAEPTATVVVESGDKTIGQTHAFSLTTSSSNDMTFEEFADVFAPEPVTSFEEVVVPTTATSNVTLPAATVTHMSGKDKLLTKFLAQKINKLNKKAEKATSSTVSGTRDLLIVGLIIIAIGLLLTLIPLLNVLSGIVIAIGAIIAIIGLLQQLQVL